MAQAILKDGGFEDIERPAVARAWADWLVETAHIVRKAVLSHRDGARVVSGASPFRGGDPGEGGDSYNADPNDAGFDILHAALATVTTFDYVWGYVTAEQTGEGPESEPASQRRIKGSVPLRVGHDGRIHDRESTSSARQRSSIGDCE